jgi:hypothetical protein
MERKDFTTKTFVAKKRNHKYSLLTAGVSRLALVVDLLPPGLLSCGADFGSFGHYVYE